MYVPGGSSSVTEPSKTKWSRQYGTLAAGFTGLPAAFFRCTRAASGWPRGLVDRLQLELAAAAIWQPGEMSEANEV